MPDPVTPDMHTRAAQRSLGGLLAPVVTTFRDDEAIDLDAFAANLRAHLAAGVDGIVVAGSTGEAALLQDEERVRLVAMARDVVPEERWLIAGTGAESTRQCIRRCKDAFREGADAVLVVAPHYYTSSMTDAALLAHYRRVADESPCPVVLYNIPKYAHFALGSTLVEELARHGNVIGIKDSSGDPAILAGYLSAQGDDFAVLTGNGAGLLDALDSGARGGILAVALFAAGLARAVRDAVEAGDAAAATSWQDRLAPLAREIVGGYGVAGVKSALELTGLHGGPLRAPLLSLEPAEVQRVALTLAAAGVSDVAAPVPAALG